MKPIRVKRAGRVRKRLREGTRNMPRLTVFRSHRYIYAQIIDDQKGETLVSASSLKMSEAGNKENAQKVGEILAQLATKKGIRHIVFDRGPYKYHGIIKEVADGVRKGGLQF